MRTKDTGKDFLSGLKLHSDFLKWDKSKNRYESWPEAVDTILATHSKKYGPSVDHLLEEVRPMLYDKEFLTSQRNLQYRGDQVLKHNVRMFNCSTTYACTPDVFNKGFYVLLCGAGLGVSLRKKFVSQLPKIHKRSDSGTVIYVIQDSIEGWAESVKVLISSYCQHPSLYPEYFRKKIVFDFSIIRPKGAFIAGGFKAPGPDGLRQSLQRISELLSNSEGEFKSIIVYDVFMHLSDAVLSGGVRRCISKNSKVLTKKGTFKLIQDIEVGDEVKTLNGYKKVTNVFNQGVQDTVKLHHQGGELICTPNHKVATINKSILEWKKVEDLTINDRLIFCNTNYATDYEDKLPKFKSKHSTTCEDITIPELDTDIAYLIGIIQGAGHVKLTSKSRQVSISIGGYNDEKVSYIISILERFGVDVNVIYPTSKDNCCKVSVKSKQLAAYFHQFVRQHKKELSIPLFIRNSSMSIKWAYISGLFCSEGRVETMPIKVVTSVHENFLKEVQTLLSELGVTSYIKNITYKSKKTHHKEIFNLRLKGVDNVNFFKRQLAVTSKADDSNEQTKIIQNAHDLDVPFANIQPIKILGISKHREVQTYDIEVEDEHSFMCEGILVHNSAMNVIVDEGDLDMVYAKSGSWFTTHPWRARSNNSVGLFRGKFSKESFDKLVKLNQGQSDIGFVFTSSEDEIFNPCFEINFSFYDQIKDKNFATFNFCNLTEINASASVNSRGVFSEDTFYRQCRGAAIIGTLQAGYTSYPYLGPQTEGVVRGEALLGVSITGWMTRPELFDPRILRNGAKIVLETNEEVAKIIGINPTARATTVKPSGNASVILQTSSGIHPEHSKRYFRIMQLNKDSEVAKYLEENLPECLENSKWSATNSDYVVYVPCENHNNAIYKADMVGIKHLELIKLVQENWVRPGTVPSRCYASNINHNVSNTVIIEDYEEVIDYLFKNQDYFNAVSFLSAFGDKDYVQAPFTSVLNTQELIDLYGTGAIFMSGLIVDGLHYFDDDLWHGVSFLTDPTKELVGTRDKVLLQKDWIRRAKKFSKNYFSGNIGQTIYCMKDVYLWHKWQVISRVFKKVDFQAILTEPKYADVSTLGAIACSGGSCEII